MRRSARAQRDQTLNENLSWMRRRHLDLGGSFGIANTGIIETEQMYLLSVLYNYFTQIVNMFLRLTHLN